MKRLFLVLALGLVLVLALALPVGAASWDNASDTASDTDPLDPDFYVQDIIDELPDDAKELLPPGESAEEQIKNADTSYFLSLTGSFFGKAFSALFRDLLFYLSLILLAALGNTLEESFDTRGRLFGKITVFAVALSLFSRLLSLCGEVTAFTEEIRKTVSVTASVLAGASFLGASAIQGAMTVSFTALTVALTVNLVAAWLMPVMRLSFASTLASSVSEGADLRRFSSLARKAFLFLLSIISTLSAVVLSFQNSVAQAQDSVAARALRFTASHAVPLVGNTVSDAVRTLSAGVALIKSASGAVGILCILLLALYPFASLLAARFALSLCSVASGVLGVDSCEALFADAGKTVEMMMAAVAILSVLYIFLLSVFSKGMPALAG